MKNAVIIITCLLVSFLQGKAQTEVTQYVPGVTTEGITYYLPKTAFKITVIATRTTVTPGDFKDYAERYLRLSNVPQETETTWKIDKIYISPYGVPDKTKVFSIPLRKKTVAPLVGLTKNGIITSINTEGEEDKMEAVPEINKIEKEPLKPRDYMTQEILYAGSKSKMAELTANEIYDIRDSRSDLSKGQADNTPKDGDQLKLMISQLNTQEQALLLLFKGTTETETKTFTLYYTPDKEVSQQILFRFSQDLGVVNNDNLAGEPIYIDVTDQKSLPEVVENPKAKKTEEQAVRYTVPSTANIKIYSREGTLAQLNTSMGQFGRTEILSNELFNKHVTTHVTFYSTTGALKKISDSTGGE